MTEKEAYNQYDEFLDSEWTVKVYGMIFDSSRVLRELDPIAYRVGFNDWCDSQEIDTDELE
jgi:hypothetical protein